MQLYVREVYAKGRSFTRVAVPLFGTSMFPSTAAVTSRHRATVRPGLYARSSTIHPPYTNQSPNSILLFEEVPIDVTGTNC